jgi:hypothetical protein
VKRLVLAAAIFAAACSKNIQNADAVKQAIVTYLNAKAGQTGLNMENITVDVKALEFERDSARASVNFRVKGMDERASMSMNYTLDRQGDHWVVRSGSVDSTNPHGAATPDAVPEGGALPPGHPGVGEQHGGAGTAGSKQ